jgi:thiamine biosynthesis protein ThiC
LHYSGFTLFRQLRPFFAISRRLFARRPRKNRDSATTKTRFEFRLEDQFNFWLRPERQRKQGFSGHMSEKAKEFAPWAGEIYHANLLN